MPGRGRARGGKNMMTQAMAFLQAMMGGRGRGRGRGRGGKPY